MVVLEALLFGVGLALLVKGADWFVESAACLARKIGVSEFAIGLTLVAVGTSVPELSNAVIASLKGVPEIVLGDIVGSNIANIGLIVGLGATVYGVKARGDLPIKDGYILIFSMLMFYGFCFGGGISVSEALICLSVYVLYVAQIFEIKPHIRVKHYMRQFVDFFWGISHLEWKSNRGFGLGRLSIFHSELRKDLLIIVVSVGMLAFGANMLVDSAVFFADYLEIPKSIIGISLVAIGTSLPELSLCISAARKGYGEIIVGNVIGSNIANTLLISSISAILTPFRVGGIMLYFTIPFMIMMSILLVVLVLRKQEVKQKHGILLLALYAAFILFVLSQSA